MACKQCKDLLNNEDVRAIYFDGTAAAIADLQTFLIGGTRINMNTLHTKIGYWAIKYKDGSIVWKKNKCFNNNYKLL